MSEFVAEGKLPTLSSGWEWTTLGEICSDPQYGYTTSATTSGSGPRFLRITDLRYGGVDWATVPYCADPPTDLDKYKLADGDIVIARSGSVGKAYRVSNPPDAVFASYLIRFRPKLVFDRFVEFFLQSGDYWAQIGASSSGNTLINVNAQKMKAIRLPLAPLAEQRRIVAEIETQFTRLDAGIAALKRVQANLKRYKASVLKAACEGKLVPQDPNDEPADKSLAAIPRNGLTTKRRAGRLWGSGVVPNLTHEELQNLPRGWTWAKVRDLGVDPEATVQVGPMSMKSSEFEADGIPVLNVGCVQWGSFDESKLNYLPQNKASQFERYRIMKGDVLFTRSGTVGRSAVVQAHQTGWLMTFHLLRVRVDVRACLPEFLQVVFEGATHIRRQTRGASIGTTRAGFNTNLLADLDIALPPIDEQKRILSERDRYLSIIAVQQRTVIANLERSKSLRQSILREAFAGRLVPQDPNDEPASELLKRIRAERETRKKKSK